MIQDTNIRKYNALIVTATLHQWCDLILNIQAATQHPANGL